MTAKKKEMSKKEKAEFEETLGDAAELEGVLDVAEGMDDLAAASDLEEISKDVMAAGVSDMTRGVDEMVVADRAAVLSDVVSVAGVIDMAEGIDLLATSDDIEVQSALVGLMSEEDLGIGMQLAAIAGRMQAVSDVTETLGMPRLTVFLREQGAELEGIAEEAMLRSGATRALAAAMSATGANVADLGANEMAEGLTRLAAAEDVAIQSERCLPVRGPPI